jgi:hypothetical protein
VFPDDLFGMPPDRDVEFTSELQLVTAPISRRPYKITPKELAELKVQLKELLDKATSIQVPHLGVLQPCL